MTKQVFCAGQEGVDEADSESGPRRRRGGGSDQAADPSATLEPNMENLNVKKFDLTFAVDPLFHKTSAQFDEGGAKGVFSACAVSLPAIDYSSTRKYLASRQ